MKKPEGLAGSLEHKGFQLARPEKKGNLVKRLIENMQERLAKYPDSQELLIEGEFDARLITAGEFRQLLKEDSITPDRLKYGRISADSPHEIAERQQEIAEDARLTRERFLAVLKPYSDAQNVWMRTGSGARATAALFNVGDLRHDLQTYTPYELDLYFSEVSSEVLSSDAEFNKESWADDLAERRNIALETAIGKVAEAKALRNDLMGQLASLPAEAKVRVTFPSAEPRTMAVAQAREMIEALGANDLEEFGLPLVQPEV